MNQLVHLRFDDETVEAIEAYRVRLGIKSSAEATRRLVSAGLAVDTKARDATPMMWAEPAEMAKRYPPEPSSRAAKAVTGALRGPVDTSGQPIKRQAKPKSQKGKGK